MKDVVDAGDLPPRAAVSNSLAQALRPSGAERKDLNLGVVVVLMGVMLLGISGIFLGAAFVFLGVHLHTNHTVAARPAHWSLSHFLGVCLCDDDKGEVRGDLKTIEVNLIRYKTFTGSLPASLDELCQRPENASPTWSPLMQKSGLRDPWDKTYQLRLPGKHNPKGYDLFSMGPDRIQYTTDDIGNWP